MSEKKAQDHFKHLVLLPAHRVILSSEDSVTSSVYQFSSRRFLSSILFRSGADSAPGGRGGARLGFDRTLPMGASGRSRECEPFPRTDSLSWRRLSANP